MVSFHPTDVELAEYASGTADWAVSISVGVHLQFCQECRSKVARLNAIGAHCLETESCKTEMSKGSFQKTLNLIKKVESSDDLNGAQIESPALKDNLNLPKVLRKIVKNTHGLKWSRISPSLREAKLVTEQNKYQVSLHRIKKGGKAVEHDHQGREIVCVIEGSFSDKDGSYLPGDYLVRNPGDTHRPTATSDRDCICLSVVEAPVKLKGLMGFLLNPFLKITPA